MGFFESFNSKANSKSKPGRPILQPASFTAPPNIYTPYPGPIPSKQPNHGLYSSSTDHSFIPSYSPTHLTVQAASYAQPCQPHNVDPIYSSKESAFNIGRWSESVVDLAHDLLSINTSSAFRKPLTYSTAATAYDEILHRFEYVLNLVGRDERSGNKSNLFLGQAPTPTPCSDALIIPTHEHQVVKPERDVDRKGRRRGDTSDQERKSCQAAHVAAAVVSGNYFSKVELYANSKLPMDLPPFRLNMSMWPLVRLAAQYSHLVYTNTSATGTKAMLLECVSNEALHIIVFAIRGTSSFSDWFTNLNTTPSAPLNFLDDAGNYCHSGFLSAARSMARPVASHLRHLLEENPARSGYSLLITGHSAGGAVASLLYAHMLATSREAQSELTLLARWFRRIHCVTFGAPPVSLLPLQEPDQKWFRNSLFLSFVNEGDPVVRADKAYVRSLVELLASPAPLPATSGNQDSKASRKKERGRLSSSRSRVKPKWSVPSSTLSNAGKIIVLRTKFPHAPRTDYTTVRERLTDGVVAFTCSKGQLRGVIWGDPVEHMMTLYAGRVELLAAEAVKTKRRRRCNEMMNQCL